MRRLRTALTSWALVLLLVAPAALADKRGDGGEGWYGETTDKVVTNAGFIIIVAFPVFVLLMSLLQAKLDKRKAEHKKAIKLRAKHAEWRGGW